MRNTALAFEDSGLTFGAKDFMRVYQSKTIEGAAVLVDDDQTVSFHFASVDQADRFLKELFEACLQFSSYHNPMYWHLAHAWWTVMNPFYCHENVNNNSANTPRCKYISVGSSAIDHYACSFYKALQVDCRAGVKPLHKNDFWLLGDLFIEQICDESLTNAIDQHLRDLKTYSSFDETYFKEQFLCAPIPFTVKMSELKSQEMWREKIESYFKE